MAAPTLNAAPSRVVPSPVAAFASLIVPGAGQAISGRWQRGLALLLMIVALLLIVFWTGTRPDCTARTIGDCFNQSSRPFLLIPVAAIWVWGVWDAVRVAQGGRASRALPFVAGALMLYAVGWQVTRIDFGQLFNPAAQTGGILSALANPDYVTRETEDKIIRVPFESPCSENPPPGRAESGGVTATLSQRCGNEGDRFVLTASGLFPDLDAELWWVNPIGQSQRLVRDSQALIVKSDASGELTAEVYMPAGAAPPTETRGRPQTHSVELRQHKPTGALEMSENGRLIAKGMGETISMALLATILSAIGAIPLSFLAARNLMGGNRATRSLYYLMRTFLNTLRSIESLILAIILVNWTGLGPLTGVLALSLHSVAALGKLYSESVENIDPGPIEAIRATGATWVQTVRYAVLPQVIPPFLGYTIYRWDINVRMAVVIGLVGGGGIGQLLPQWINQNQFRAIGGAFWAIVVVVAVLDFVSAKARERWG